MSILLVVITFVLFMVIGPCLRAHRFEAATTGRQLPAPEKPPAREAVRQNAFEIPSGYCFHPGHTWAVHEGGQIVRIGLDGLAAALIGRIKKIEVTGLHRWVQQGQRVWTVTHNGFSVELLSPAEGAVVAVNPDVLRDPGIVAADPYRNGWILAVRSPDLKFSLNNLMKGRLVRA